MSSRIALRNCLYGININEGPLYFASSTIKEKLNLISRDENVTDPSGILNSILYHICNTVSSQEDIVKASINDQNLDNRIREKWDDSVCVWSCFLLSINSDTNKSYQTGSVLKFNDENEENTHQYTRDIINFSKSFGIPTISKLISTVGKPGYMVNVVSCESQSCETIDHFDVLPVKYAGHHPLFNFSHSTFKCFSSTRNVIDIADCHLTVPEINRLRRLTQKYKNQTFPTKIDANPKPFIVVEGLDAVGKTTLVNNLSKRLGARVFRTPPDIISEYREIMVKQCEPVCRAFYSLGNYLVAETIKDSLDESPVVLDRFWHSSAAYAIALEAKCGGEENIPPKGHHIYQWPEDLLKPSAVIYLELSESDRLLRMRERGEQETNEELQLKKSRLLRQRLTRAYKNMENPSCIIIDASKTREEVCENVIRELRSRNVFPNAV